MLGAQRTRPKRTHTRAQRTRKHHTTPTHPSDWRGPPRARSARHNHGRKEGQGVGGWRLGGSAASMDVVKNRLQREQRSSEQSESHGGSFPVRFASIGFAPPRSDCHVGASMASRDPITRIHEIYMKIECRRNVRIYIWVAHCRRDCRRYLYGIRLHRVGWSTA